MPAVCGKSSLTHMPDWPCWRRRVLRAEQLRPWLERTVHEGEALALDVRVGNRLAVEFVEARFVVEEFELRRAAGHEEVDDVGAGGEMAGFRGERVGGRGTRPMPEAGRPRSREPRAMEPRPREQRLKKCRRVRSRSRRSSAPGGAAVRGQGGGSFAGDGFVEVQQDAGDGLHAAVSPWALAFVVDQLLEAGAFGGFEGAGEAETEGVVEASHRG
jgi:hypothetical protein